MTSRGESARTLIEQEESTQEGKLDMAAARLAVQVSTLLNRAVESSGVSQRELAAKLGVTEGRVSQVLCGNGNVQIATAARFLRALGYQSRLIAMPCDEGVPEIPAPRQGKRRRGGARGTSWVYEYRVEGVTLLPDSVGCTRFAGYGDVHPTAFDGPLRIVAERPRSAEAAAILVGEALDVPSAR